MSKNNGNKARQTMEKKMSQIAEINRTAQMEVRKFQIACSHQNEKGKLKIKPISDNNDYQCKYCGTQFNMNKISKADLTSAAKTIHDAIQQVRSFADPDTDEKRITLLGELDYNLQESVELYERTYDAYGNGQGRNKNKGKNKNKNRDDNDLGSYGMALDFMGGGRRR